MGAQQLAPCIAINPQPSVTFRCVARHVCMHATECSEPHLYADMRGYRECRKCGEGYQGVAAGTDSVAMDGPHIACTDSKCQRPEMAANAIDRNSMIDTSLCPQSGNHSSESPSTCTLRCKRGYYGSAVWTCRIKKGMSYNAAYQSNATEPAAWCTEYAHTPSNCHDSRLTAGSSPTSDNSACAACPGGYFAESNSQVCAGLRSEHGLLCILPMRLWCPPLRE